MVNWNKFQADDHEARLRAKNRRPDEALEPYDGPEGDLHDKIIAECQRRRWYFVHSRMDKKSSQAKGVPDFIIAANLIHPPQQRTFWIECKRKEGKLTPEQTVTKHILIALGHRYACVYSFEEFLAFVDS